MTSGQQVVGIRKQRRRYEGEGRMEGGARIEFRAGDAPEQRSMITGRIVRGRVNAKLEKPNNRRLAAMASTYGSRAAQWLAGTWTPSVSQLCAPWT